MMMPKMVCIVYIIAEKIWVGRVLRCGILGVEMKKLVL